MKNLIIIGYVKAVNTAYDITVVRMSATELASEYNDYEPQFCDLKIEFKFGKDCYRYKGEAYNTVLASIMPNDKIKVTRFYVEDNKCFEYVIENITAGQYTPANFVEI